MRVERFKTLLRHVNVERMSLVEILDLALMQLLMNGCSWWQAVAGRRF